MTRVPFNKEIPGVAPYPQNFRPPVRVEVGGVNHETGRHEFDNVSPAVAPRPGQSQDEVTEQIGVSKDFVPDQSSVELELIQADLRQRIPWSNC